MSLTFRTLTCAVSPGRTRCIRRGPPGIFDRLAVRIPTGRLLLPDVNRTTALDNDIEALFDADEGPPCPDCTALLIQFAETLPEDFAYLRRSDFISLANATFAGIPEWDAFARRFGPASSAMQRSRSRRRSVLRRSPSPVPERLFTSRLRWKRAGRCKCADRH
jgi:hypothetical protein